MHSTIQYVVRAFAYFLFSSVLFLALYVHAHAALLYFDPGEININRGDTVTLGLRIDTDEGECINTVDAVIKYDPAIRAVDISRGDSILNIWLEDPKIDEENHTITLAGGLPGGYCGRIAGDPSLTNVIAELVFRSPGFSIGAGDAPTAKVWVEESSQVLIHDGFGTPAALRTQGATITLLGTAGETTADDWRDRVQTDTTKPADFLISLFKDDFAFSGRYFISFNSHDKQSGIDHYEVMEEPFEDFYAFRWGRADAPWVTTESPYVLTDQTLNSTIRVKAIDKAGNETVVVLVPEEAMRSVSLVEIITWVVGGTLSVALFALIVYVLWRRKKKLLAPYENNVEIE